MAIKAWQAFEQDVYEYLMGTSAAKHDGIIIKHIGGNASNASDIEITTEHAHFFVECKYNGTARFGQTVLRQGTDGMFMPSTTTKPYWQPCIDALNAYDMLPNVSRSSLTIPCSQDTLEKAVLSHYSEYDVRFIVTGNRQDMRFIDLQDDIRLRDFFRFSLHVRRKLSGSNRCTDMDMHLMDFLSAQGINATFKTQGGHQRLIVPEYVGKLPWAFSINGKRYRIALNQNDECEVRKLSNTANITMLIAGTFTGRDCSAGKKSLDVLLDS